LMFPAKYLTAIARLLIVHEGFHTPLLAAELVDLRHTVCAILTTIGEQHGEN